MKYFFLKIILFCLALLGSYYFFIDRLSDKFVDENYPKFTHAANGLILGQSRANQGINPKILENNTIGLDSTVTIVNFAFDGRQSFYGKVYLEAVKKKIKPNTTKGIFILSVNPGSFSVEKNMENDTLLKMDEELILGKLSSFNEAPNYDYIMNCYSNSLYNAFLDGGNFDNVVIHPNGWKEIKLKTENNSITESDVQQWKSETIKNYTALLKTKAINATRYKYFLETIHVLKQKGDVILVRIPTANEVLQLENENWKNFDQQFDSIAKANHIAFFKYSNTNESFKTYDGSHLISESAIEFTSLLSKDISKVLQANTVKKK